MSAIDFAKSHVGKQFIIPADLLPPGIPAMYEAYDTYAQIVGYINSDYIIVVELEENSFRKHCWPLYSDVILVINQNNMYDGHKPMVMAIDYRKLKEQKKLDYNRQKKPVVIPPKPYPSICRICTSPARNNGKLIMCSNKACSSRSALFKAFDIKPVKADFVRCPRKIGGKCCNKRTISVRTSSKRDVYIFDCEAGHKISINVCDLKKDSIVLTSIGGSNRDRIWDGQKWDMY